MQDFPSFEIVVVDNGSKDGSVQYLSRNYPQVRLIALKENTGFCGAVNVGIRSSSAKYILLLNNDTMVQKGFIQALVQDIKKSPDIFSCQAKMLQMHDHSRIDDAGNYYCALGWAFADGKGKPEENYNKRKKIFASCAGAAIYRKSILDKIGYFDEEHFAYLEDLDIGYRARLYGYSNWFCPEACVFHVGSGTSGSQYNLFKVRYSSRNNIYTIYKNMPLWQITLNFPFIILGFGAKAVFFTHKGFGFEYLAGIKNGIEISIKNKNKKVHVSWKCNWKIQRELFGNIIRRLL